MLGHPVASEVVASSHCFCSWVNTLNKSQGSGQEGSLTGTDSYTEI